MTDCVDCNSAKAYDPCAWCAEDEAHELNARFDAVPYIPTDDGDFLPLRKVQG